METFETTQQNFEKALMYAQPLNPPNTDYSENKVAYAAKRFIEGNTKNISIVNDGREDVYIDNCLLGDKREILYDTVQSNGQTLKEKRYTPDGIKKVRKALQDLQDSPITVNTYICTDKESILALCDTDTKEALNHFICELTEEEMLLPKGGKLVEEREHQTEV